MKNKPVYRGWHFLNRKGFLRDGTKAAAPGHVEKFEGPLCICLTGLHASKRLIDALRYAPGVFLRKVELADFIEDGDKACGHRRRILIQVEISQLLTHFAQWCAERAQTHAEATIAAYPTALAAAYAADAAYAAATAYAADAANAAAYAACAAEHKLQNQKLTQMVNREITRLKRSRK